MEVAWIDWFGYIASLVVLVSLTMVSIIKLRWINLIGCLLFSIFGFLINSLPTALMNLGISCINIYYLYNIYRTKEEFVLLEAESNSKYFKHFLSVNEEEIKKQISNEELEKQNSEKNEMINLYMLRNNNIAGILLGEKIERDTLLIKLDYVIPAYRDYKLGSYFFNENTKYFKDNKINKLVAKANEKSHKKYLEKIGFVKETKNLYVKTI